MSLDSSALTSLNLGGAAASSLLAGFGMKDPATSIKQVIDLTEQMFGGPCKVTVEEDPEIEYLTSLVFEATTSRAVNELVALRLHWHREVRQLVPDSRNFCLLFDINSD